MAFSSSGTYYAVSGVYIKSGTSVVEAIFVFPLFLLFCFYSS
jgi:hypothetical protein